MNYKFCYLLSSAIKPGSFNQGRVRLLWKSEFRPSTFNKISILTASQRHEKRSIGRRNKRRTFSEGKLIRVRLYLIPQRLFSLQFLAFRLVQLFGFLHFLAKTLHFVLKGRQSPHSRCARHFLCVKDYRKQGENERILPNPMNDCFAERRSSDDLIIWGQQRSANEVVKNHPPVEKSASDRIRFSSSCPLAFRILKCWTGRTGWQPFESKWNHCLTMFR